MWYYRRIKRGVAVIAVAATALLLPAGAVAERVVDQQQLVRSRAMLVGGPDANIVAQPVAAGVTGRLVELRLAIECAGDLDLEIRNALVQPGVTPGTQFPVFGGTLASQRFSAGSLSAPGPDGLGALTLATPLFMPARTLYAIVLQSAGRCILEFGPDTGVWDGFQAMFDGRPNPPGLWFPISSGAGARLVYQTIVDTGCLVPAVRRLGFRAARAAIERNGCALGAVTRIRSTRSQKGRVLRQTPGAGSWAPLGTPVRLRIGRGP